MKIRSITMAALVMCCVGINPIEAQGAGEQGTSSNNNVYRDLAAWRHTEAREMLEEQKATAGKSAGSHIAWAVMLAQERKLDQAVQQLSKATRQDKSDPAAAYFLGEVQSWKKQNASAAKAWRQARDRARAILKEDKRNGWAMYWQGAALIRLGEYSKAEAQLKKSLKNGADRAMGEYQLGLAQMYQKKWEPARAAFNRCLRADSGFSHAYYYRGRVWQELGKTEKMLLDMDRFLKLAPDAREANAAKSILRAGG